MTLKEQINTGLIILTTIIIITLTIYIVIPYDLMPGLEYDDVIATIILIALIQNLKKLELENN